MTYDVVLAGVGGQGVVSLSSLIAAAAIHEGLHAKQSETHGMAQRGGSVSAHLRLSDGPVYSELVPAGGADLILAMEPLEVLRYLAYLSPSGAVVSAAEPVQNFAQYPPIDEVLARIRALPRSVLVDATRIAREAGSPRAANLALVGAASPLLPVRPASIEHVVRDVFASRGASIVEANLKAFRGGREVGRCEPAR